MGRYIGPKTKIARKFGEAIFGTDRAFEKKNYPPGQHGRNRKKVSEYGTQLKEKQKAKAEKHTPFTLNIHPKSTVYKKNNSAILSHWLNVWVVSQVKTCCVCWKAAWIT